MKRVFPATPIGALQEAIMTIVRQKSLYPGTKMERIIALGAPLPSHESNKIVFTREADVWDLLKRDQEFWNDVLAALHVPSFDELEGIDEQIYVFGEESVIGTLDAAWYEALLARFPEIADLEPRAKKRRVREAFLAYMRWYDKEATPDFLIVYANALKDDHLVPLAETLEHGVATKPTLVASTLELVGPQSDGLLADLSVISVLDYHTGTSHFKYYFYMRKTPKSHFTIEVDAKTHQVETHGLITRVLKFLYQGTVILVITGPCDSKLVRFRYNFKPQQLIVVDDFLPVQKGTGNLIFANEVWEDLVYVDERQPTRYATNKKSVPNQRDFFVLDLQKLATITSPQSGLSEEERKAYIKQQIQARSVEGRGNFLSPEERAIFVEIRERKGILEPVPNEVARVEINKEDYDAIQRTLFVIQPQDPALYHTVSYKLALPLSPIFIDQRTEEEGHRFQSKETLGWRVIRVPGEEREDRVYFAVLNRYYINEEGAYTTELHVFTYVKKAATGDYVNEAHTLIFVDLEHMSVAHDQYPMMERNIGPITIKDFNVIFDTTNDCRVEVTQLALLTGEIKTMSSRRFKFRSKSFGDAQPVIRDAVFFDLMARHHYRIHDYRHDTISNRLYECLFTKYNYANKEIRILVYKKSVDERGAPSIADVRAQGLEIPGVESISPQHMMDNLCFITFEGAPGYIYKLKFKQDQEFISLPPDYDLSARVTGMNIEKATHCVFCGNPQGREDRVSGNFYCGKVCQYIFCKTRAM